MKWKGRGLYPGDRSEDSTSDCKRRNLKIGERRKLKNT